jgi:hypothetical protein
MREIHPLAQYIPIRAKQDEVEWSIAERGLQKPVVLYENMIVEGRVRYRACREAGIEPQYVTWKGDGDVFDWMVREHIKSHEPDKAAMIQLVASISPYYRLAPGSTDVRIRAATGVGLRSARTIAWLVENEKMTPEILNGIKSSSAAANEAGYMYGGKKTRKQGLRPKKYSWTKGDHFDEVFVPLRKYLNGWRRRDFKFTHVNPKEATYRIEFLQDIRRDIDAALEDLEPRSVAPRHTTR